MRSVSLGVKVKQVTGLAGTSSVDEYTNAFLEFIEESTKDGGDTSRLTAAQINWIDRLFAEHFA